MMNSETRNELLKEVEQLPPTLQREVIDFARSLARTRPRGTPGDQLLRFAGIMTPEEGRDFLQAIDEDCERVEPDEW